MKVAVLGTGCPKCQQLLANVQQAAAGLSVEIEKVTQIKEIAKFGVLSTPALAIDGVVKVVGRVPSADEIKQLLRA